MRVMTWILDLTAAMAARLACPITQWEKRVLLQPKLKFLSRWRQKVQTLKQKVTENPKKNFYNAMKHSLFVLLKRKRSEEQPRPSRGFWKENSEANAIKWCAQAVSVCVVCARARACTYIHAVSREARSWLGIPWRLELQVVSWHEFREANSHPLQKQRALLTILQFQGLGHSIPLHQSSECWKHNCISENPIYRSQHEPGLRLSEVNLPIPSTFPTKILLFILMP